MKFKNIVFIKGWLNWFNFTKQENHVHLDGRSNIVALNEFCNRYPAGVNFLSIPKLEKAMEYLRSQTDDVQIVALGGMGKTRLLYETFKDSQTENAYYCYHSQGDAFTKELDFFFQDESHKEGLLVLDNCNNEMIAYARSQRMNHGCNMRLVFAHHDFFDQKQFPDTEMINYTSRDMKDAVDEYILREVLHSNQDRFICDRIKEMADGYPQMAIILVDAYKKNGRIGVNDVESLLEPMLGDRNDEKMKVMQCLSLFQPLGYRSPVEEQFNVVLTSSILTGMHCSVDERRDIFTRQINHFNKNGELIEISSSWLNVRPLPLAIWLMGKWIEGHDENRLLQLINEFEQLPKPLAMQMGSQMYRRFRYMEGNEKASLLISELLQRYENSPFGAEGVVCSELGSRLFLGFAHVNPLATAHCMNSALVSKSIDELRQQVKGSVRRNIVWTLEKLCYPADCFPMAAECLLQLAAAENETFGNSATGQLTQLFHILLPGTTAKLEERTAFLRGIMDKGGSYIPLLLQCLDSALLASSFTKMSGAELFGYNKVDDYIPQEGEATQYWHECALLLKDIVCQYPDTLPEVKRIIQERSYALMRKGWIEVVDELSQTVYDKDQGDWMEMYSHYSDMKRRLYPAMQPKSQEIIDRWLHQLSPHSFSNELKEIRMKVFESDHKTYNDEQEYADILLQPAVIKFVEQRVYDNADELRAMILDKQYFDFNFSKLAVEALGDDQLELMLSHFLTVIRQEGDGLHSPFLFIFCQHLKERIPFGHFLCDVREEGFWKIYVHLLVNIEDGQLAILHRIECEIHQRMIPQESLIRYLNQVGWMTSEMLLQVLDDETVQQYASVSERINLVERIQLGDSITDSSELLKEVKSLFLSYEYDEKIPSHNVDYGRFLVRLLEKDHDPEFAKSICRKMIDMLNSNNVHANFDYLFHTLLDNYMDDVWDYFSERFVSEEYAYFFYQVKDEVGSGYDFGRGVMYQHGDERIKKLCQKYPNRAPYCVALTCPVFTYKDNGEGEMVREARYSDILVWVLENYGHQDNTLDGAGGNIGSFAWTGSPIGLFQLQIASLKKVVENKQMYPKVRKWANDYILHFEKEIKREQNRLDFERMHYK